MALLTAGGAAGCVIPPSLEVENQDAGVNSPPAITAVRLETTQLSEPGPIQLLRGSMATLQVEAVDTDDRDSLYVRLFVAYTVDNPTPRRAGCVAGSGPAGSATRSCTVSLNAICQKQDVDVEQLLSIRVFDREPDDDGAGNPPYLAMPDSRGLTTAETFTLRCVEPLP